MKKFPQGKESLPMTDAEHPLNTLGKYVKTDAHVSANVVVAY